MHPLTDSPATRATSLTVPGASTVDQPSKALEVATFCCLQSGRLAPRTSLLPHPLQDSQVTIHGGIIAHIVCIPRTAVLSRPLQAFQVTVSGCQVTCICRPRAQAGSGPLQAFQMTIPSCPTTFEFIPSAALPPQPHHRVEVTATGCPRTSPLIHQEMYLVLWYVPPVRLEHIEIAITHCNHDDAIHALGRSLGHVESPAPPSAPVPAEVLYNLISSLLSIVWPRHELSPGLLLRLTVLLRSQREGRDVLLVDLRRDHRPNLRWEAGDFPSFLALAGFLRNIVLISVQLAILGKVLP